MREDFFFFLTGKISSVMPGQQVKRKPEAVRITAHELFIAAREYFFCECEQTRERKPRGSQAPTGERLPKLETREASARGSVYSPSGYVSSEGVSVSGTSVVVA